MSRFAALLALLAVLPGCAQRVQARPGLGVGVSHRPDGGRVGVDLGEWDVGGAVADPRTGSVPCVGPECGVPGGAPGPFRAEVTTRLPGSVLALLIGIGAAILGLGYLTWRNGRAPRPAS